MQDALTNRSPTSRRGPGRPRKDEERPTQEAQPYIPPRTVPPLICPRCGQGMQPRVRKWVETKGAPDRAMCTCTQCGAALDYTPPQIGPA